MAKYLRTTVMSIMEMPAVDVFGWWMVLQADVEVNNYKTIDE